MEISNPFIKPPKVEDPVDQISFWLEGEPDNGLQEILFSYPKGIIPDHEDMRVLNKEIALSRGILRGIINGQMEKYKDN